VQPPREQFDPQEDGALAISADCIEHGPAHVAAHADCEQDALLGQLHDPGCPTANPIPASSRTIDAIASFFIFTSHSHLYERRTFTTVDHHYSI
jgi:hypothetical protein